MYLLSSLILEESKKVIRPLIISDNKFNVMTPAYGKQLTLEIWQTNVGAYKIDSLFLETFRMIIAGFQVIDKLNRAQFF